VLADIKSRKVDQMVCHGDAIQGGPLPAETVRNLRAVNCPVVMGNADAWLLTGIETGNENIPPERKKKMEKIRRWSLKQLTADDRAFIESFQPTVTIPLTDTLNLLCFHGSPSSFDDVILPAASEDVIQKFLGTHNDSILTGGHTHAQQIRRNGDLFFFNPGSVGFAFSHQQPEEGQFHADSWAEYAILTEENGIPGLAFRRVPFDVNKLIRVYRESGRPFANDAIAQYQK
jgi:predicted phosphodiesterase